MRHLETQIDMISKGPLYVILPLKMSRLQNTERILKTEREKCQFIEANFSRITPDLSAQTLKVKKV
jgi:prolyl-tRNA synthetase